MFSFTYENWKDTCESIKKQSNKLLQRYLQWYPFSMITRESWRVITNEAFFNKYIKSGAILYYPENWFIGDNYVFKNNGAFRETSLISPILFLIYQTIGKNISTHYRAVRSESIDVFYSGNYEQNRSHYKKEYDTFFKKCNEYSSHYKYYIKTDIKDFFPSININELMQKVDDGCEKGGYTISQKDLLLYKELISCLGKGNFPQVDQAVASSYFATIIYLDEFDSRIENFLNKKHLGIANFSIIRYVDDLWIFINPNKTADIGSIYSQFIEYCASELKSLNLSINSEKTFCKEAKDVREDLKRSIYDEYVNGIDFDINDYVGTDKLGVFIDESYANLKNHTLDFKRYSELIEEVFKPEEHLYTAGEIFNALVYDKTNLFKEIKTVNGLSLLLTQGNDFLKKDPKRLVVALLKTENGRLITSFLNNMFFVSKSNRWNRYDSSLAITYLHQRKFKHEDLLKTLKVNDKKLYEYVNKFCLKSFVQVFNNTNYEYIDKFLDQIFYPIDTVLFFLYCMFKIESIKGNHLPSYAYYKNFFDRISSHFGEREKTKSKGKPNYNEFYKEAKLKDLYKSIINATCVIANAHEIRNGNPVSHASAELIDDINQKEKIMRSIVDLDLLVKQKILTM